MAIECEHPRPPLDLPGYTPKRQAWQVPAYIPGLPPDAARVVRDAFQGVYNELGRLGLTRNVIPLYEDVFARPGAVIQGVGSGQTITLAQPGASGYLDPVTILLTDVSSPVKVVHPDGTVTELGGAGAYTFEPAGEDAYATDALSAILAGGVPTDVLLGRDTAGTGEVEFIAVTAPIEFDGSGAIRLTPMAADTFLGRLAGSGAPTTQQLSDVDSTSIVYDATSHTFQSAAKTGDVTAAQNSNAFAFRSFSALSVLARASNSSGIPTELAAGANDRVLARASDALAFQQVSTGMIADDAVTNAKLANMAEARVKGRAIGAGTGDPQDLTGEELGQILREYTAHTASGASDLTDYVPSAPGIDAITHIYIDPSADILFNSLTVPATTGKRIRIVKLANSNQVTIVNDAAAGTATMRFTCVGNTTTPNIVLRQARSNVLVEYEGGTWKVIEWTPGIATTANAGVVSPSTSLVMSGSEIQRAALTGDVTSAQNSTVTAFRSFSALSVLARAANSTGVPTELAAGANDRVLARTGDALSFVQLTAGMVPDDLITNAKLANVAAGTVKGLQVDASGPADPVDLTGAEVVELLRWATTQDATISVQQDDLSLNADTTVLRLTPTTSAINVTGITGGSSGRLLLVENVASTGNNLTLVSQSASSLTANRFRTPNGLDLPLRFRESAWLRWDTTNGDWRVVAISRATNVADQDYGDITVSSGGQTWTIDAGAVTLAKMSDLAQSRIVGRAESAGTGVPQALTPTQVVAIIDGESPTWTGTHAFNGGFSVAATSDIAIGTTGFGVGINAGHANAGVSNTTIAINAAQGIIIRSDPTTPDYAPTTGAIRLEAPNDMWMSTTAGGIELNTLNAGHTTGVANGQVNVNAQTTILANAVSGGIAIHAGTTPKTGATTGRVTITADSQVVLEPTDVLRFFTGGVERLEIENDGAWQLGGSTGTVGHTIVTAGASAPPAWGQLPTAGIADAAVTLAKTADLAQSRITGRAEGAGTGVPQALTPTQVVAIIDGESPTWTASHRFDSYIQFGTSTGLPSAGDIRKAGALSLTSASAITLDSDTDVFIDAGDTVSISAADDISMSCPGDATLSGSVSANLTSAANVLLSAGDDISLQASDNVFLDAASFVRLSGGLRRASRLDNTTNGTINNLAIGNVGIVRFTNADILTGMVATADWQEVWIINASPSGDLLVAFDSASSSSANQFAGFGTSRTIRQEDPAMAIYDGTSAKWRLLAGRD